MERNRCKTSDGSGIASLRESRAMDTSTGSVMLDLLKSWLKDADHLLKSLFTAPRQPRQLDSKTRGLIVLLLTPT